MFRVPSILVCPPATEMGIDNVWLETVTGVAPGVRVLLPEKRLVGFPVRVVY